MLSRVLTRVLTAATDVNLDFQISDELLPKSRRQIKEEKAAPKSDDYFPPPKEDNALKRKREEAEQDPKLKEFLEIYQPPSKTNIWTDGDAQIAAGNATAVEEPIQDVVVPADESDDEYQVIAKKPKILEAPQETSVQTEAASVAEAAVPAGAAPVEHVDAAMTDAPEPVTADQPTTDDDWLRSRTNRLLDLVEDDDVPVAPASAPTKPRAEKRDSPVLAEQQPDQQVMAAEVPAADSAPSEEDKVRETGRLYLRNLHFEVTEEDIRTQFSKHGSLDEVSLIPISSEPLALG